MRYTKLNFTIMAKESVKILKGKLDVDNLLVQLNAALSEEWLAYYQYWIGAFVAEGAMRANVQAEFEEHAKEELGHAKLLADRIIELEGVPVLDPKKWFDLARSNHFFGSNTGTPSNSIIRSANSLACPSSSFACSSNSACTFARIAPSATKAPIQYW